MHKECRSVIVTVAIIVLAALALVVYINPTVSVKISVSDFAKISVDINTEENTPISTTLPDQTPTDEPISFIPESILIPSIDLKAKIVPVKTESGRLDAPLDFNSVGWSMQSALAGSEGTVILDGHYDNKQGPAIFYRLKDLKVNDSIEVYSAAQKIKYRVVLVETYDRTNAPTDKIFKDDKRSRMNLITCSGIFDKKLGTYDKRLVVYTLIDRQK